VIFWGHNSC